MHCFYHQDQPAVVMCKSCLKGLCHGCAEQIVGGYSCGDEVCIERIQTMERMIDANKVVTSATRQHIGTIRSALFVVGLAAFVMAYIAWFVPMIAGMAIFLGMLAISVSFAMGRFQKQLPDLEKDPKEDQADENPSEATF